MSENYSSAKIYKIVPNGIFDEGDVYIGSTIDELDKRFLEHVINYYRTIKKYIFSSEQLFNKYGTENCRIELVELFPCNSIEVLQKRKGEIINKTNCINKKSNI